MRDHGGNLDAAMARFGGTRREWIDLSTGINPRPFPLPQIPPEAWTALPTQSESRTLIEAAARAYGCSVPPLPLAGAQAAIQLVPRLAPPGVARVLEPTYNEHAAALRAAGWEVQAAREVEALSGADLAVVVNPNNPDGQRHDPAALLALAANVGMLVVDESFVEIAPDLSLAGDVGGNLIVLRSFGKFYGLAGLRLGFALAGEETRAALSELAGPWAVSGPALAVGRAAFADAVWRQETRARLCRDSARLDRIARTAGWVVAGGTDLFRLYVTSDAATAQGRLAEQHIWTRRFPHEPTWLRLGLPDRDSDWQRIEVVLSDLSAC